MAHRTVLLGETIELIDPKPGQTIFEGTAGEGGLSTQLAERLGPTGRLIVTDLDREMLERTRARIENAPCQVILRQDNFRNIKKIMESLKIPVIDGLVLDLGIASYHVDESRRGFTFEKAEPLQMTFDEPAAGITADLIVNKWSEQSLADIIWGYGGERRARVIARAIVRERPIMDSRALASVIASVTGRSGRLHPATKTFQAIRIAVNDELAALDQVLNDGWPLLQVCGRLVVISFHELEGRIVKNFFKSRVSTGQGRLLTRKPIAPGAAEVKNNPRSRSAKLRAITKIHD